MAGGTMYPAAYYLVLGVEASASNLQRASFSNYDPDGPIYSEDGIDGRNYEVRFLVTRYGAPCPMAGMTS